MKKETAVEFIRRMYDEQHGALYGDDFEQAKKMEKEQTIDFATNYIEYKDKVLCHEEFWINTYPEEYYEKKNQNK